METTTRTANRWITAAAAIAVLAVALVPVRVGAGQAVAEEVVTIVGATGQEAALVDWALDLYEAAGIELRPITIVFHSRDADWEPCNGAVAYYTAKTRRVDMCNSTRPDHERRRWILHELGHAHTFATMSGDDVDSFTTESAASSWNDPVHRWQNRGQERAADIVAWGLNPDPEPIYWMRDIDCGRLTHLYRTVTGLTPSHDC
jgi:hypothetical protein